MGRKVHLQKDVDEIDDVQSKIFRLSRSWRVDPQGFFWLTFKLQKNCSHMCTSSRSQAQPDLTNISKLSQVILNPYYCHTFPFNSNKPSLSSRMSDSLQHCQLLIVLPLYDLADTNNIYFYSNTSAIVCFNPSTFFQPPRKN